MMESSGIRHNMKTYSMLINGFLKLKDWANAFAIFEDLVEDGLKPDVVLYNNVISAFCGMGNMDRALHTVKEMQKERHRPTTRTFMPIIHGFARAGEMRKALEVFDMMRMSGCIPTVHTYNALILGLVEKRKVNYTFMIKKIRKRSITSCAISLIYVSGFVKIKGAYDACLYDKIYVSRHLNAHS